MRKKMFLLLGLLIVHSAYADNTFSDANWVSLGAVPGTDGNVSAVVVDASGDLYIGGNFGVAGSTVANNVARWNGTNWSALGSGLNGGVKALAMLGGTLYAAGSFTMAGGIPANCIAQWDGTNWSALGSGMEGLGESTTVNALALSDDGSSLYAGGAFYTAGGNAARCIARWDGSNWSALGSGLDGAGQFSIVNVIVVSGGMLYAGGAFYTAGGNPANFVAQWDGGGWSPLGSGVSSVVYALAVSGSTVYVGGNFTKAGGNPAKCIAQWDGNDWSALGAGMNAAVNTLLVSGDTLYAGGYFNSAGGIGAGYIAKWNGTNWSTLGSGLTAAASVLVPSGDTLYVGGGFTSAGGNAASHLARWNGTNWSAFGLGLNTQVQTLAVAGSGTVYAGGSFAIAGVNGANCIAQWNGTNWSALGSGVSGGDYYGPFVQALAVSGGTLYAGGDFYTAGGNAVNYIAQWNGTSWSALGSGTGGGDGYAAVFALAVSGGALYAGGRFTTADGNPVNRTAQWNGTYWSALGSGLGVGEGYPPVYALAVSGGTLYAGGRFTTANGDPVNHVAQWNGSYWSALGSGMNGEVKALGVMGGKLYAGGSFTTAGGYAANYIAQWDGNEWSALASGMNDSVNALAVSGGTLYAGGYFTAAGGNAANYIAQWNGTEWSPLASGVNHQVSALAVSGDALYVGGAFTTAGGKVSAYAAKVTFPVPFAIITTNAAFGFHSGMFGFDLSGPAGSNAVIQASTDLRTWIPLRTNLFSGGLLHFSDSQSATNRQRCYRAVLQ